MADLARIRCNHRFDYSATIMHNYLRVLLPPALGPSRLKAGHGSCNARYDLSACCAHEGETDTDDSAPEGVDPEEMLSSPSSSRAHELSLVRWIYNLV